MRVHAQVLILALVGAVVAPIAGCTETPAQGFEAFYAAVAAGDEGAFLRLSSRAQAELGGAARKAGQEPAHYLVSATPKTTVRSIAVVEESADTAVLDVKDALGTSASVHMVKENGRWRVDLSL